jgi:hypothetical protein
MQGFGIVESGLISGNYNSGGGRSPTNHLNLHYIQFGLHREHHVLRLERRADDRSIRNEC